MSRLRGTFLFLLLAVAFILANKAAFQGWFYDDDLDNLIWTARASTSEFAKAFDPRFIQFNFRPVGHLVYRVFGQHFGLEFAPFLLLVQGLHLFNAWLMWIVLRRLGASIQGACAGTLLFAFHIACFDAWWKPMFMFDVLVTTFILIAFLLWLHDRWLLALIPFYLAFKSKELAVVLPAFLLAYEFLSGRRRWRRVIPYAVTSAWFVYLGSTMHKGEDMAYTLRYSLDAVATTLRFYSSKILLLQWAGLLLIPAVFLARDWRIRFGLLAIPILIGPLWFLPGRLFAVYLYLPLVGLCIAFAFAAQKLKPVYMAALFALWIPWNYQLLRENRREALSVGPENRAYYMQLKQYAAAHPNARNIVYDGGPSRLAPWGITAILKWLYPSPELRYAGFGDKDYAALVHHENFTVIGWDRAYRKLLVTEHISGITNRAFIDMREPSPVWQLGAGWSPVEAGYRWTEPVATLVLQRPRDAAALALTVNLPEQQIRAIGRVNAEVIVDGVSLGSRLFERQGKHTQQWPLRPGEEGTARVEVRFSPPFHPDGDPRALGAAVCAIGFISEANR